MALRSGSWGRKLLNWPVGETLTGKGVRDLTRVGDLPEALRESVFDAAVIYAPTAWVCTDEMTRTKFYEEEFKAACEAQQTAMERWTMETCVPQFDLERAAGCPSHWNYIQPHVIINKSQEYFPPIRHAEPNHDMLSFSVAVLTVKDSPCSTNSARKYSMRTVGGSTLILY